MQASESLSFQKRKSKILPNLELKSQRFSKKSDVKLRLSKSLDTETEKNETPNAQKL
jgi:hypothetical protein